MSNKLMTNNRQVGSLWCTDVLSRLADYVDGELSAPARAEVEFHVAGCDNCRRFGGEFADMVTAVRRLSPHEPLPVDAAARLRKRLASELG